MFYTELLVSQVEFIFKAPVNVEQIYIQDAIKKNILYLVVLESRVVNSSKLLISYFQNKGLINSSLPSI
jgi:hypothetical protein